MLTIATSINISLASKDSIFIEDGDIDAEDRRPNNRRKSSLKPHRAWDSLFHPLENLTDTFDHWSSQIKAWAARAQ